MAGHYTKPNILADSSGLLTRAQAVMMRDFAKRAWMRMRSVEHQHP
jgi:hypothetical protein